MVGVLVNVAAVIIGGALGLLLKKGFPQRLERSIMCALGLCVTYIGYSGTLQGSNVLVLIFAMVFGVTVGTLLKLDDRINALGKWVEARFSGQKNGSVSLAEGFVTASLLFCVGAMTVVGSLNAGLTGDNSTLYTKSLLDFFSAMMLATSLGPGVILSAAFVLVLQGGIALLAGILAPLLSDPAIAEMTCSGSLLIFALGLNMLGITKIKVANLLPAIVFAPCLLALYNLLASMIA